MSDLADGEARRRAVEATGSILVQAPAGSGKTTLLAQRYLRLLAVVQMPERILALTFTRRAAQEMRERVLQALQSAGAACPPDMHPQTWQLGCAAQRHMQAIGIDLQRHPARLRIETIDAFDAWLAGQLPVTAGAGARLRLTDKPAPLYAEAARRALAHDAPGAFGQAVDLVLALGDQRWNSLVELIAAMLPSRDRWLPLLAGHLGASSVLDAAQLAAVRRHLDEDLGLLVGRTLQAAHAAFGAERLAALGRLLQAAALRVENPALAAWRTDGTPPRADVHDLPRWRGVAATLLTQAAEYRSRLTKNEGFPPQCDDKQRLLDLIEELRRTPAVLRGLLDVRDLPAPTYDAAQWTRVRAMAQVLVLAAAELEQVFRERGMADFPAVSMAAVRALGSAAAPSDLALRLDYRLEHILVDEFQDTSSAQLELIKLLTAGWQCDDGRSIFCVGDPMQSIYGFRQAEVRAFLELAEEGIGAVPFEVARLRSNFRSAAALVDWTNASFAQILPQRDDRDRGAIAFRPSVAVRGAGAAEAGVTLRGYGSRREEAEAVADLVARQTLAHPEWRIAILVRARSHARDIAASLAARAVAFRAVAIEPLEDRPPVRDLVMLIRALTHLGDRTAWLAVLRAPWCGLLLADLLEVARAEVPLWQSLSNDTVLAALSEDGRRRCARLRGVLEAAFAARTRDGLARWMERTWIALGGPACAVSLQDQSHVHAVLQRLAELDEGGLPDAADLPFAFADLYAERRAAAAVEIMTIHKSKGLEYDLVVVPALDRSIARRSDELLLSHEFARSARDGLVLAARAGIGEERDPLFDFLRHLRRQSAALEAERLLYVACTRAKTQLHLTATVAAAEAASYRPPAGSLLAVLWPVAAADFSGAPAPAAATATPGGVAPPSQAAPLRRLPADWIPRVASHESAATPGSLAVRQETPVFDWAGETARRVGTLVHAELQWLDPERTDEDAIVSRSAHYRRWLAQNGVPDERLQDAVERVLEAVLAVRRDSRAHWILRRGYRDDVREHALSALVHGELQRVVFDRSFVDAAGIRWVIDYKTSRHAGGSLDEFLDREVERYRPQLARYAEFARRLGPEPVRVGLYFPLMRAWREWNPS